MSRFCMSFHYSLCYYILLHEFSNFFIAIHENLASPAKPLQEALTLFIFLFYINNESRNNVHNLETCLAIFASMESGKMEAYFLVRFLGLLVPGILFLVKFIYPFTHKRHLLKQK